MTEYKYKRVLLKLSGEALAKKNEDGAIADIFDDEIVNEIASVIKKLVDGGVQVGVVVGAGNIWRGVRGGEVNRARGDQMGMLATMINSLRLEDAFEKHGCKVSVMSPIQINTVAEPYDFRKAVSFMENGGVVIFGCGTGIPFVSTDTTGVVRAAEIGADIILMAKNIDGVYNCDPRKPGNIGKAQKYRKISYDQCLKDTLHATDVAASAIAEEQKIDMYVFALSDPENILAVVRGEEIGTYVSCDKKTEAVLY